MTTKRNTRLGRSLGPAAPRATSTKSRVVGRELSEHFQYVANLALRWLRFSLIAACSSFLFVVIVTFYGGLVAVAFELARLSVELVERPWSIDAANLIPGIGLVAAIVFLVRCCGFLFDGVTGLVTEKYDDVVEATVGITLSRNKYAQLHSLVAEIGQLVNAPAPDEIRVVPSASCYVAERRRFSISPRRHLILAVGLPHLAVLSLRELKVILAHELAHFRCGDTRLQVFFYRFQRSLQVWIRQFESRLWCRIDPFYWLCRVYFLLVVYSSGPIRRRLELRADALSAEVCGGEFASQMLLKEWLLARQFDAAVADYSKQLLGNKAQRGGNVYRWFARRWRDFSHEGHEYLLWRLAEEERPSFFDSHPTIAQRVDNMRQIAISGPEDIAPIRQLVCDLPELEDRLHATLFNRGKSARALRQDPDWQATAYRNRLKRADILKLATVTAGYGEPR